MAEETKPLTTTESRVGMRHRFACMCAKRGEWRETLVEAQQDRDEHIKEHV